MKHVSLCRDTYRVLSPLHIRWYWVDIEWITGTLAKPCSDLKIYFVSLNFQVYKERLLKIWLQSKSLLRKHDFIFLPLLNQRSSELQTLMDVDFTSSDEDVTENNWLEKNTEIEFLSDTLFHNYHLFSSIVHCDEIK